MEGGGLELLLFLLFALQTRFADKDGPKGNSQVWTSTLGRERASKVIGGDTQGEGATWDKVTMVAVAASLDW